MSSEKHPNLQLHKWAPTDYVKREEWNENFGIIDDKIGILNEKFSNAWVDVVKDFGADPTGATDSTTAIQNAINSLRGKGGTVYFPNGVYLVSNLIVNFSFVRLLGQSRHAILKLKNNSNNNVLSILGIQTSYCAIENLRIDGNKANNTLGNGLYIEHNSTQPNYNPPNLPTDMYDARHVIDNVLIENCADNGIYIADYDPVISGSGVRELYVNKVHIGYCGKTGLLSYAMDSIFNEITSHHSPRGIYIGGGNTKWSNIKTFWCNSDNENFVLDSNKPWETASIFINAVRTILTNIEIQDWYGNYALSIKDTSDLMGENIHVETCRSSGSESNYNAIYIDGGTRNRLKAYTNYNSNASSKMGKININNTSRLYLDLMTRYDYTSIINNRLLSITSLTNSYVRINERVRHDTLVDVNEFLTDTEFNVTTGKKGIKFKINGKDAGYLYVDGAIGHVRLNLYDANGAYLGPAFRVTQDGSVYIGGGNTNKLSFFDNIPISRPTAPPDATDLASAITLVNSLKKSLKDYGLLS